MSVKKKPDSFQRGPVVPSAEFAFFIPDEDAGVSSMATVYTAYECETSESQRRPHTLLDALERGDHCNGADATPATGPVRPPPLTSSDCNVKNKAVS